MKKLEELQKAKSNVKWLLEEGGIRLVDMKGLTYWAKRVEELREEIKKEL